MVRARAMIRATVSFRVRVPVRRLSMCRTAVTGFAGPTRRHSSQTGSGTPPCSRVRVRVGVVVFMFRAKVRVLRVRHAESLYEKKESSAQGPNPS